MSKITFERKTINESLQMKYTLPSYQREYKWTEKQLSELLTDLQDSFLDQYEPEHGRKDVGSYKEYFLGTIITTDDVDGKKVIIDGQQRLTTITLILSYFQRIKFTNPELKLSDFESLIRKELYGDKNYNISFSQPRIELFDTLLNSEVSNDDLQASFETIPSIDRGTEILFNLYITIENYLNSEIKNTLLPYFTDFVINKVMLFEIGVPSEQDAHRVFVTMNDRGLKLAPVDLLKGFILSNISDNQANIESHQKWTESINGLNRLGFEEDSQFIKTMLRAVYATSIRGKKKGDSPGDFDNIGEAYHRWVVENKSKIPLNNSDDFQNFVSEIFSKYATIYIKIKNCEAQYQDNNKYVYYNYSRNLTLQSMVILSGIDNSDTESTINKKIKAISAYLDIFLTTRIISGQDNTYDNVRDPLFNISQNIRNKTIDDLKAYLKSESDKIIPQIDKIVEIKYDQLKRQDLLHILARICSYLEEQCSQTNSVTFCGYIDRTKGNKTFDIEHILASDPNVNRKIYGSEWDFASDTEYKDIRNNIGGLILLPRGRNRSLKDKSYNEKRSVYATENISGQTLTESYFQNNPTVKTAFEALGLEIRTPEKFNKSEIESRKEFYKIIAKKIWNNSSIINA